MTLGKMLAHLGTKDISERMFKCRFHDDIMKVNSEYHAAPAHTQHLYYSYEPPVHVHPHATSKHHYGYGGGKKNNAAMSALTLLAFLFFLHILQQCLKEHMQSMANPQIMIMSAAREEDMSHLKKIDKSGAQKEPRKDNEQSKVTEENKFQMTKIKTSQYSPQTPAKYAPASPSWQRYRNVTYPDLP